MAQKIYFDSLDSLRGLAAIAIAWYHYRDNWGGYLAVDFFLVLSGFVLSHSYLYGRRPDFGNFLVSRLARLYPLHLYALVVYFAVFAVLRPMSLEMRVSTVDRTPQLQIVMTKWTPNNKVTYTINNCRKCI